MSPAPRKPRAKKPKALKATKGYSESLPARTENDAERSVRVHTQGDDVIVTWTCGGTRTFTPDDLRASIDYLEMVCVHGDVWLSHSDSRSTTFSCVVEDGEFHAHDNITEHSAHLPWDGFKAKLEGAIS